MAEATIDAATVKRRKSGVTNSRAKIWIKNSNVKIVVNVIRRFFGEAFEGSGLMIEAVNIAESDGPKAAIKAITFVTALSPPPIIGARNQAVQEIRNATAKKAVVGWLMIFCLSSDCAVVYTQIELSYLKQSTFG
jgi:hypothetical protein